MFKYFKWNNSLPTYCLNRIIWFFKNLIAKYTMDEQDFRKYKQKQQVCIWCKRIYIKGKYFCSKKCERLYTEERFQSFKHNNRCKHHPFQILTYKNKCWECFVDSKLREKYPRMKKSFWFKLHGFKTIPTFRTSHENWNGDKVAFEQFLRDYHVKWFVYIKFYENKNGKIRPLVVGKSGSMLVNGSGSDLNFSTAVSDGQARQFIHLNGFQWHYEHIMIKKCKNESHAYYIETKIQNKFDLFGS